MTRWKPWRDVDFWFASALIFGIVAVIVAVIVFYQPERVTIDGCRNPHIVTHGQTVEVDCP